MQFSYLAPNFELMKKLLDFFLPKVKYAFMSGIATSFDAALTYTLMHWAGLPNYIAGIFGYGLGFLVNFFLQKKFIFESNRKTKKTFVLSAVFTTMGAALQAGITYGLNHLPFLEDYPFLAWLIAKGIVFFFNFYTRQFAFEKKMKL